MNSFSALKKALFGFAMPLVLVLGVFFTPQQAGAQTVAELQAQIQALLAQITALQEQLARTGGGGGSVPLPTPVCPVLTYNLYLGLGDSRTEGQVSMFQKYLASDSSVYPEASITGYFGPLTEQAVQRFQRKHNIVSSGSPDTTGYGVVGPATRAKMREMCGATTPPQLLTPSNPPVISGVSGPTSLNVGQSGTWTVQARDPLGGALSYSVVWGDESSALTPQTSSEVQTATFTHTYTRQGVFNPTFTVSNSSGSERTSISVNVGSVQGADLTITDLTWVPLNPTVSIVDPYLYFTFTVKNTGTVSAFIPTNTKFTLYKDNVSPSNTIGLLDVGIGRYTLAPGETKTYTNITTTQQPNIRAQAGTFNLIMMADATNLIAESNENNNSLTKQLTVVANVEGNELKISPVQGLDKTIIAGSNNIELAQIILDATDATEDLRITQAQIFADVIAGDLDNYQSLQFYDGTQPLNTGSNVVNPSGTPTGSDKWLIFTIDQSLVVSKGTTKTISLKGNITTQSKTGDAIKFDFSNDSGGGAWIIVGAVSGNSVGFSAVGYPGSIMTIATGGSWQVNQAPSAPAEKWVVGASQGVVSNVLRFSATNEDMSLAKLRLQLRQPAGASDIARIYLYDGNTLVTSKIPSFVDGVEDFTFPLTGAGSFIITKDISRDMTIRIDLASIGSSQSGTAGQFVAVDFDGDGTGTPIDKNTAVGRSSGNVIHTSTQTDIRSNGVRYFRSLPIVERVSIPTITLTSGNNILYRFRVIAQNGDAALRKVVFQTAITGNVTLSNFVLWDTTDAMRVNAAFSTAATNPLIIKIVADTTDYPNPWVTIPVSKSHTFELRADVVACGDGVVSTKLLGDAQYPVLSTPMGTAAEVEASSNIAWSDFSADIYTTHSLTTKDWANGFKLPGMLSTGLGASTLSGGGVCDPPADTTPPSAPANLTATAMSSSQINLSWTASADNVGVTGYRVERCQGSTACTNFVQIATPAANSYSNTGITAGTTYRYRVRAGDAAGNLSGYSYVSVATPSLPDTTPPSAPTGLFEDGANYGAGIILAWNPSTDNVGVARYKIERCTGSTCANFVQIGVWASNNYTDTEIVSGVVYRYRVRAEDAAGNLSGYSNIIAVTAANIPGAVTAPSSSSVATALESIRAQLLEIMAKLQVVAN